MGTRHKILLVDDDQDLLDLYREILAQLSTKPEIFTSTTGARAMAMLEAEPFTLLICDLNMPKMDGLQVLSIVRRKYPDLRTVVLTSVMDEQFRSRVYSLGVDLFWQKPGSGAEIKQFLECIESLLGRESQTGFRGVQSKSLVDIIQLECLSQNSITLKITNGPLMGRIWIDNGNVIDATTEGAEGEAAFHKILSWKSGNFEVLPAESGRTRTIHNSYQGLLLETAQAQDEALGQQHQAEANGATAEGEADLNPNSPLAKLSRLNGVEFILVCKPGEKQSFESRGLENPEHMAKWSRETLQHFHSLVDKLRVGPLQQIEGLGPQRNVSLAPNQDMEICVGWKQSLSAQQVRESMKTVLALWVS
ncbi:MAG: Response regulator receiver protein [Pedosphaera sp.]|nr:Response regulator receiver protein [Pedosphaera sp.]